MNEMFVAVFETEEKAVTGLQTLKELHQEGGISLFAWALVVKARDGNISVRQQSGEATVGTALGLLMGGIVGILGGPAGSAVGASLGAYLGLLTDLARHGIDLRFLDDVSQTLGPGKAAVLAEIEQSWVSLVELRLQQQDATVFRQFRADVIDDQLLQEENALQAALQRLVDDLDRADAANRKDLDKVIVDVKQRLAATQDRAKAEIDRQRAEMDLKVKILRAQAETAAEKARTRIRKSIADLQAGFETRSKKLSQALARPQLDDGRTYLP